MIKHKTIATSKGELLVIGGLPEDTIGNPGITPYEGFLCTLDFGTESGGTVMIVIDDGDWRPLGWLRDLTEEQWKLVVDREDLPYECYTDYCNIGLYTVPDALTSGLTLIDASVKTANEYGDECPNPIVDGSEEDDPFGMVSAVRNQKIGKWRQAEAEVYRNIFLMFKSNQ